MNDEKKVCSNCKKDIAVSNYDIHFAHCCRNIEICQRCSEPVPRKEIERHLKLSHAVVPCERCKNCMERWKLNEHEDICSKRPISCLYCELDVSWDEIKSHESYCGARTKQCQNCKKYVMIKDGESHVKECLDDMMVDEVQRAVRNRAISDFFKSSCNDRKSHLQERKNVSLDIPVCNALKPQNEHISNQPQLETSEVQRAVRNRTISDPLNHSCNDKKSHLQEVKNVSLDIPVCDSLKLQNEHISNQPQLETSESSGFSAYQHVRKFAFAESETESDDEAVASVSASFSKLSTRDDHPSNNNSHFLENIINEISDSNTRHLPHRKMPPSFQEVILKESNVIAEASFCNANKMVQNLSNVPLHQNLNIIEETVNSSVKPVSDAEIHNKRILQLPSLCPLCKKEFPISLLKDHVLQCDYETTPCTICGEEVKLRDKDNHVNTCKEKFEQSGNRNKKRTKRKTFEASNHPSERFFSDDFNRSQQTMLPCEFCGEQFPDFQLILHQSGCKPELFSSAAEISDTPSGTTVKPAYSAVVTGKSTVLENACADNEPKDAKILVGRSELDKPLAPRIQKQNKRGKSGSVHYASGRQARPGEFLPVMQYAGFPDCYKIYDSQGTNVIYFGTEVFPQYSHPETIYDVQLYAGASKYSYEKSGMYSERNSEAEKSFHHKKSTSIYPKGKMPMQHENSESDSIYESCESNSGSDSRKKGTQNKRISNKQEEHSSKKEKSSQYKTSKKNSKKSKKHSRKKRH